MVKDPNRKRTVLVTPALAPPCTVVPSRVRGSADSRRTDGIPARAVSPRLASGATPSSAGEPAGLTVRRDGGAAILVARAKADDGTSGSGSKAADRRGSHPSARATVALRSGRHC